MIDPETTYDPITAINTIICAITALRLLLFRRDGAAHVRCGGILLINNEIRYDIVTVLKVIVSD